MNFKEIADWLNENGYKTLRGKSFRNNHTHSIIKKKRSSDERFSKTYLYRRQKAVKIRRYHKGFNRWFTRERRF